MALPSLVKTWRFNSQSIAAPGTILLTNKYLWWAVYNAFRGQKYDNSGALSWTDSAGAGAAAPSVLFTTDQSCDAVVAGTPGDNVDRLDSIGDIKYATSNGDTGSWYTLKSTAIGIQITSFFNNFSGVVDGSYLRDGWISSILGFSTAGSTTVRPTAADEANFWARSAGAIGLVEGLWLGASPNNAHVIHTLASTDGKSWRIIIQRNGYTVFMMVIDVPQSPVVLLGAPNHTWNGDDLPYVAIAVSTESDGSAFRATQYAYWTPNNRRLSSHCGNFVTTTQSVYKTLNLTTEISANGAAFVTRGGKSSLTNKFPACPAGIFNPQTGFVGRSGVLSDMWWGTDTDQGVSEGDNYPEDLSRQFVALGSWILPWNSTVMPTS